MRDKFIVFKMVFPFNLEYFTKFISKNFFFINGF